MRLVLLLLVLLLLLLRLLLLVLLLLLRVPLTVDNPPWRLLLLLRLLRRRHRTGFGCLPGSGSPPPLFHGQRCVRARVLRSVKYLLGGKDGSVHSA